MWFLFHFSDRHAKFWNMVAFPLAPVGFAQACQHPFAFLLDRDHQVIFFCLIGGAFTKHPDGLVGTSNPHFSKIFAKGPITLG